MQEQNYKNHRRLVPLFHIVLGLLVFTTFVLSIINLVNQIKHNGSLLSPIILIGVTTAGILTAWYTRSFAATVQDRAIRAEENFRYFVRTGKALDPHLTMSQIIALRFAPDEEFDTLAKRAVTESLSNDQIKQAITHWRADNHRI